MINDNSKPRVISTKATRHRIKRAEEIQSVKDVVTVLAVHTWELKEVEKYGGNDKGFLSTMYCRDCGAECSLLIMPSTRPHIRTKADRASTYRPSENRGSASGEPSV